MQELFALQHGLPDVHTAWFEMRRMLCTMVRAVSRVLCSLGTLLLCNVIAHPAKLTCTVVVEQSTASRGVSSGSMSRHNNPKAQQDYTTLRCWRALLPLCALLFVLHQHIFRYSIKPRHSRYYCSPGQSGASYT